jgi:hypothetical protein
MMRKLKLFQSITKPWLLLFFSMALMGGFLLTLATVARAQEATSTAGDPAVLTLNEFMADNETKWIDPDDPGLDEYPDWFELYNPSGQAVSLDGLYLSDDPALPTKFAITDGLSIPAGGYVVFYADNDPEQGPFHTNFKLNRNKEAIGLYGALGTVLIDSVSWGHAGDPVGALMTNVPYGRYEDGGDWQYLYCATPGAANRLCNNLIFAPLIAR